MSYWSDRQSALSASMEKDEAVLKARLSSYYETESTKLGNQIASYYSRYGEDNVIEYRTMLEKLDAADTKLLYEQMNTFAVRYPEYAHLLPVRESIYNLNRLEGLEQSIKLQQLEIGAITNAEIQAHLEKQALLGANSSMEMMGYGKNFYTADSNVTKSFVNTTWVSGTNFSSKVWANSDKLAKYIAADVAQGFARGDNYSKLVTGIMQRFENVNRNDAYRLIYTEGTYVMAESTIRPFEDKFEQYKISTVGDGKVCSICSSAAGQVFNITDRQPGVNFPPFHPWCRCSFEIHVDDWDKWLEKYENNYTDSAESLAEKVGYGKIESIKGSQLISGALNPMSDEADQHAEQYYESVRKMKTDVARISKTTGKTIVQIQAIKDYLFNDIHDLRDGRIDRFDPTYSIAQSWQRLINGQYENIDKVLIEHEIYEMELRDAGMSQDEAHTLASKKYDYKQEVEKYYDISKRS